MCWILTGSPFVQKIYGSLENPTYGKMYSLNNDNLEKIIVEYIYEDIMEDVRYDIKSAVLKEYFSNEILQNFDITFNNENIDTSNILNNKYVIWNIGSLAGNKTASLKYTLKIKNMQNKELFNKILKTSEQTDLTYINYLDAETLATTTSSPKIQLSEVKEKLTATVSYDPTAETTGTVKATIKTNKKVNKVEGWTLLEDGKTLTKEYTKNATETVHLVDVEGMTTEVEVSINNIKTDNSNTNNTKMDNTIASGTMPYTGSTFFVILPVLGIIAVAIYVYKRNNDLRGI